MLTFGETKTLIIDAGKGWLDDKASRLGAAIAYYTAFSIAPLLVITIAVVGFIFGAEAARGEVAAQINMLVGKEGGEAIQDMIKSADENRGTGIFATIISIIILIFGASGVFVQLKDALNTVWDVPAAQTSGGIKGFFKSRFLSFGFVLGVGFLLMVSLVISTIISALGNFFNASWVIQLVNFVVSFGVITALFAMIFKFLPDIKLPWRDVWLGAAITAVLFSIGKWGLGIYLARGSVASAYGAAGSFVALLVWIFYSAQIVFFGAELTEVYSSRFGAWKGRVKRTEKMKCEMAHPPKPNSDDDAVLPITAYTKTE